MKLTEQDLAMFSGLHNSQLGRQLTDYLNRVKIHIGYVGNLKPGEDLNGIRKAIDVLDSYLVDKITKQNNKQRKEISEFE